MSYKVTTVITSDKAVANNESRLSICLTANGFSLFVVDGRGMLDRFVEAEFDTRQPLAGLMHELNAIFSEVGISTFGFKSATLVVPTNYYVWIPAHLHESVRNRQYLKMVANPDYDLGVYHISVPLLKSVMVFCAPADVVTAFKLVIPGIDVHCQHSVLAHNWMTKNKSQHPVLLLHVRDGVGDFEAFFNRQLLLSNSFNIQQESELVYRAIELMKQLHLETPDMELSICGNVGREFFAMMQPYFPNVTLFAGPAAAVSHPQFRTFPAYRHVMLLS